MFSRIEPFGHTRLCPASGSTSYPSNLSRWTSSCFFIPWHLLVLFFRRFGYSGGRLHDGWSQVICRTGTTAAALQLLAIWADNAVDSVFADSEEEARGTSKTGAVYPPSMNVLSEEKKQQAIALG